MKLAVFLLILLTLPSLARAERWNFKAPFLQSLVKQVPVGRK